MVVTHFMRVKMLDPNKHGVFNNMKTISGTQKLWKKLTKKVIKGVLLSLVLILSSIGMYVGGEFSDIAFCIWCLTIVQLVDFMENK